LKEFLPYNFINLKRGNHLIFMSLRQESTEIHRGGSGVSSVVTGLPRMCEVLGSIPSTGEKGEKIAETVFIQAGSGFCRIWLHSSQEFPTIPG
jgi:hypothetical protein